MTKERYPCRHKRTGPRGHDKDLVWSGHCHCSSRARQQDECVPSDKPVSPVPPHCRPHCRNLKLYVYGAHLLTKHRHHPAFKKKWDNLKAKKREMSMHLCLKFYVKQSSQITNVRAKTMHVEDCFIAQSTFGMKAQTPAESVRFCSLTHTHQHPSIPTLIIENSHTRAQ